MWKIPNLWASLYCKFEVIFPKNTKTRSIYSRDFGTISQNYLIFEFWDSLQGKFWVFFPKFINLCRYTSVILVHNYGLTLFEFPPDWGKP